MNKWCDGCPLSGRPLACPQTHKFIRGCMEFSLEMAKKQSNFYDFCESCEYQRNCPQDMYYNPLSGCNMFEVRKFTVDKKG